MRMNGRAQKPFGKEREYVRLELSSEGRYGLRALIYLAEIDGPATRDTISAETQIPRRLLARVLARLSGAGLVDSQEGRGGGSRLARPSGEITLRDAVEAIEGPFEVTRCIMEQRACGEGAPCLVHEAWEEGQETILDYLKAQTLSEFVSRTVPDGGAVGRGYANPTRPTGVGRPAGRAIPRR